MADRIGMGNIGLQQAINRLIEGNRRFVDGARSLEPMLSHLKMAELAANGQKPFAIILTCSDSRSPAEMIFDQGVGDLFVVRVAGNVVGPSLLASIEFAAVNFVSPVIVVLGHTQCGAVNATIQQLRNPSAPVLSPHLEDLLGKIRPAVEAISMPPGTTEAEFNRFAIEQNILRSQSLILEQSQIISSLAQNGAISVIGALLDISTGVVTFLSGPRE